MSSQDQSASFESRLGDYNDVPARIAEFRRLYPEGSLQPANLAEPYKIERLGDRFYVVVVAAAYRTPADLRPGIGMAYEQWPGKTPYTRDSELQNAETSAWGRAIVATLAADTKRGIASLEEVRNRKADNAPPQWDDVEQRTLVAGWEAEIKDADGEEAVKAVGRRLLVAKTSRELSPDNYEKLKAIGLKAIGAAKAKAKEAASGPVDHPPASPLGDSVVEAAAAVAA